MARNTLHDSLDDHARIRALLERVQSERIWHRSPSPIGKRLRPKGRVIAIDRDRIVTAILAKGASSHKAIRVLVEAGCSADARTLARVLMENAVVFLWVLEDPENRIDNYQAANSVLEQREAQIIADYYSDRNPELVAQARAGAESSAPLAEILGGSHHQWARIFDESKGTYVSLSASQLFQAIFAKPGEKRNMMYDLPYFHGSAYVHSSIGSITHFIDWKAVKFALRAGTSATSNLEAVSMANLMLMLMMNYFQGYLGYSIFEPDLEQLAREIDAASG